MCLWYFFQSLEVSLHVTAHGTRGSIRCGKMVTQDSGTAGLVRTHFFIFQDRNVTIFCLAVNLNILHCFVLFFFQVVKSLLIWKTMHPHWQEQEQPSILILISRKTRQLSLMGRWSGQKTAPSMVRKLQVSFFNYPQSTKPVKIKLTYDLLC